MNIETFESYVMPITITGCWIWMRSLTGSGYGHCGLDLAHRVSYKLYKGSIPEGLFILHSCDVRSCVNPDHLRAGTQQENVKDAVNRNRHYGASKTYCKHGHMFTEGNTLVRNNKRSCRICQYISNENSRQRRLVRQGKDTVSFTNIKEDS